MPIIKDFISRYKKEFDFYEQSSKMVEQILENNLRSAGIRAIVTSRAKNSLRLEDKVRQRNIKKQYKNIDEIYCDIVDLGGVRVALYFPAERDQVDKVICNSFTLNEVPKKFPLEVTGSNKSEADYKKRFSGYWATHYRVQIPESLLNDSQKRYSEARIEIQVASVLMHAWSEVEHDLVYKPLQGNLSTDEYAILDELNGMMLAGEIALERLQQAGKVRASTVGRNFSNHFELASTLSELAKTNLSVQEVNDAAMGRVDILFHLLKELNLNTPENLENFIKSLHSDFDRRPLSEQIIDLILQEDPENRYKKYKNLVISKADSIPNKNNSLRVQLTNEFMSLWIEYEKLSRSDRMDSISGPRNLKKFMNDISFLEEIGLTKEKLLMFRDLRNIRNRIVHGLDSPSVIDLENAIVIFKEIFEEIKKLAFRKK